MAKIRRALDFGPEELPRVGKIKRRAEIHRSVPVVQKPAVQQIGRDPSVPLAVPIQVILRWDADLRRRREFWAIVLVRGRSETYVRTRARGGNALYIAIHLCVLLGVPGFTIEVDENRAVNEQGSLGDHLVRLQNYVSMQMGSQDADEDGVWRIRWRLSGISLNGDWFGNHWIETDQTFRRLCGIDEGAEA